MKAKLRDTQKIDFLTDKSFYSLNKIKEIVINSPNIQSDFKIKIIKKLPVIIGNQEIEWVKRNNSDIDSYIFNRYKFKIYPKKKILESFPLYLLIELASLCNLRCIMCFQSDETFRQDVKQGFMDIELFKNLVDQAVQNECKFLTLASRGEPTLHPKFKDMIYYCKGKFLELKINTNATVLNENLAKEILDSGVDIVVFSIDSCKKGDYEKIRKGSNFENVLENIKRFVKIRNSSPRYKKTSIRVSGVFLKDSILKQNKRHFSSFWKRIVDNVSLSDVITRWHSYDIEPLHYENKCNLLWQRLYIWYDGTCNPCDFDYKSKLKVGSAKTSSIKEIWTGEAFTKLRQLHIAKQRKQLLPCDRCSLI